MTLEELTAKAAAIKAEWVSKAIDRDEAAERCVRECYPEEWAAIVATRRAAEALTVPKPWSETDRDPGEEG